MTTVKKYRKKPVVVEAVQWDGSAQTTRGAGAIADWIREHGGVAQWHPTWGSDVVKVSAQLTIITLEGAMEVSPDDFVIKGVQGEFYPCKPDIFEATYDGVPDVPAAHARPAREI